MALAAIAGLILASLMAATPVLADHEPPDGPAVTPTQEDFPGGDPDCPAGTIAIRFNDPAEGDSQEIGDTGKFVTLVDITDDELTFVVDSPWLAAVVFVKGGTPQNVYDYSGLAGGGIAHDDGLVAPNNASGEPAGLSHIDFCLVQGPESTATPTPTPEGSQAGGTGTPAPSVPNTALSLTGSGSLATIFFGAVLIASLGALAYANVTAVRRRR